jgi:hypothetical protein
MDNAIRMRAPYTDLVLPPGRGWLLSQTVVAVDIQIDRAQVGIED